MFELFRQYFVPQASGAEKAFNELDQEGRKDWIVSIAQILRQRLPDDLVPVVLDHAQLWIPLGEGCKTARGDKLSKYSQGVVVLSYRLPSRLPSNLVRRITFTTTSRDPGWGSPLQNSSTNNGIWTWFEVSVRASPEPQLEPRNESNPSDASNIAEEEDIGNDTIDTAADLRTLSHSPMMLQAHSGRLSPPAQPGRSMRSIGLQFMGGDDRQEYIIRGKIITKIHDGKEWKTHVVVWDVNHDDPEVRRTIKQLRAGDVIELGMFAGPLARSNYLQSAKIEVEGTFLRKL